MRVLSATAWQLARPGAPAPLLAARVTVWLIGLAMTLSLIMACRAAAADPIEEDWQAVAQWVLKEGREGFLPGNLTLAFRLKPNGEPLPSKFKAYRVTGPGDEFIRRLDVIEGGDHLVITISKTERGGPLTSFLITAAGAWESGFVALSTAYAYLLPRTETEEKILNGEKAFWLSNAPRQ